MKKSLIWITAGIVTVGFGVPVFAARGDTPEHIAPASVTVATTASTPATSNTVAAATVATVAAGDDSVAHDATDDNGVDATTATSVDDNGVDVTTDSVDDNGVDDATENSVEDVSGPCDEAEHASDPACTGVSAAPATSSIDDNSAHSGGSDDNSSHSGGNDSGSHGGNEADG